MTHHRTEGAGLLTLATSGAAPDGSRTLRSGSFERLYRAHWPAIVDYLRFRVGPADASDLAADVFTRAWAARSQFDADRGEEVEWIWGIARNAARDWHRRVRPANEPLHDAIPGDADPADLSGRAADSARVASALHQLEPIDQDIVALRFGGGLSHREVGAMLGLSEAAAAQRLHRAVRRVRQLLEGSESQ